MTGRRRMVWMVAIVGVAATILGIVGLVISVDRSKTFVLGVASGLAVWLATYAIAKLIDRDHAKETQEAHLILKRYVEPHFPAHDQKSDEILKVVRSKPVDLVQIKREDMKDYARFYERAKQIKVSGVALQWVWHELLVENGMPKPGTLLAALTDVGRGHDLEVQLLLYHPECGIVKERDSQEGPPGVCPVTRDVHRTVQVVRELHAAATDPEAKFHLARGNSLDVRLTRRPLNSTLFYVETANGESTLLMGTFVDGWKGQECGLYLVTRGQRLHEECLDNFRSLFDGRTRHDGELFRWTAGYAWLSPEC